MFCTWHLYFLSYFAEEERNKIKIRQAEGIAIAKANGKHLGRPKIVIPKGFENIYKEWKAGSFTAVEAMKRLKLTKTTFYKLVKDYEGK